MRKRTWTDEQLQKIVPNCISILQVISDLNLSPTGGNHASICRHINRLKLDTTHFKGQGYLRGTIRKNCKHKNLDEILVENSSYQNRRCLKRRLLSEGVINKNECSICGISYWRDKPLTLVLDHINGRNKDNRKENLRLLCPNCNSQTNTFAGRNIKKYVWPSDDKLLALCKNEKLLCDVAKKMNIIPSTFCARVRRITQQHTLDRI